MARAFVPFHHLTVRAVWKVAQSRMAGTRCVDMMGFIARRITRFSWIGALLVFTVMSVGGTSAGVAPSASASPGYKIAPAATPDFFHYCVAHGYPKGATDPVNGNAYDYACIAADGSLHGFNGSPPLGTVGDVCRWSNRNAKTVNVANVVESLSEYNFYAPWEAWGCQELQVTAPQDPGLGVDVGKFCTLGGYDGVELRGNTARSWYCYYNATKTTPRRYSYLPIDMAQACARLHPGYLDNTSNFYDPYSPKCRL